MIIHHYDDDDDEYDYKISNVDNDGGDHDVQVFRFIRSL